MDNGELLVSTGALIRIFLFLLYVPVVLFSYWQLVPRLSPTSKRLASVMLAAQVVVIVVSLEIQPTSDFEEWLWNLDREWNIPSTLASTQLALVGVVALVIAWLAKARPAWQRLYLVGIGLIFLFLALDEFVMLHERIRNWERYYVALGAVVVATTAFVAMRSPRRTRIWHLCLLVGLAMSGIGAILVEAQPRICGSWGFLRLDECLRSYNFEETLEFLGIWLVLVAMLGLFSDAVPMPKARIRRLLYALPALWFLLLIHDPLILHLELRLLAQPVAVEFESGVHLHGYRIDSREGTPVLRLFASARQRDYKGLGSPMGYSLHLVDQVSGESVASHNEYADVPQVWLYTPSYTPVFRHDMELEIPSQTPLNRAFWIVLTLWREKGNEFVLQEVLASDQQLLSDTQVVLGEIVLPAAATAASPDPLAVFDNGFTLDAVDMPERSRPGETLTIHFNWRSSVHSSEDHAQFLHFVHQESGALWNHDQQPLGPRLPTRLWYNGLADSETWQVSLPADLAPGRYAVFTGLYRLRDLERIPASDPEGTPWLDARVPLGSLIIEQ